MRDAFCPSVAPRRARPPSPGHASIPLRSGCVLQALRPSFRDRFWSRFPRPKMVMHLPISRVAENAVLRRRCLRKSSIQATSGLDFRALNWSRFPRPKPVSLLVIGLHVGRASSAQISAPGRLQFLPRLGAASSARRSQLRVRSGRQNHSVLGQAMATPSAYP